ncbi:hypothetical protein D3C81_1617500 [compost metagenome]
MLRFRQQPNQLGRQVAGGLYYCRPGYTLFPGTVYLERLRLYWGAYTLSYEELLFWADRYGDFSKGFLLSVSGGVDGLQNKADGAFVSVLGLQPRPTN